MGELHGDKTGTEFWRRGRSEAGSHGEEWIAAATSKIARPPTPDVLITLDGHWLESAPKEKLLEWLAEIEAECVPEATASTLSSASEVAE
jgi:hypothetical protein